MQKKIIKILGSNHTDPISFNNVSGSDKVYGLYTFENNVFVFKDGMDLVFNELTPKEQKNILEIVESGDWVVDKTLQ